MTVSDIETIKMATTLVQIDLCLKNAVLNNSLLWGKYIACVDSNSTMNLNDLIKKVSGLAPAMHHSCHERMALIHINAKINSWLGENSMYSKMDGLPEQFTTDEWQRVFPGIEMPDIQAEYTIEDVTNISTPIKVYQFSIENLEKIYQNFLK